jgi:hypothetical protein
MRSNAEAYPFCAEDDTTEAGDVMKRQKFGSSK